MRHLTFILLLLMLLLGCSTQVDDMFEPFTIGTWEITSPESADWQGKLTTAKGDTVLITSTESHSISMIAYDDEYVNVSFIETDLGHDGRLELIMPEMPEGLDIAGFTFTRIGDGFEAVFRMSLVCNTSNDIDIIEYPIYDLDFNLVRFYKFDVEGFVSSLRYVARHC